MGFVPAVLERLLRGLWGRNWRLEVTVATRGMLECFMCKLESGGVNHCTVTVPLKIAPGDLLRMLSLNCFSLRLKRDPMWEFISKTFQRML